MPAIVPNRPNWASRKGRWLDALVNSVGEGLSLSDITEGTLQVPLNMAPDDTVTAANTQLVAVDGGGGSPQIIANVPGSVGDVTARFSVQVQGVERGLINATGVVSATGVFCAGAAAATGPAEFRCGTNDGSDSTYALFSGGGGWADPLNQPAGGDSAPGYTRGSTLYLYGNEHPTAPSQSIARCATGGLYRWFINEIECVRIGTGGALSLYNSAGYAGVISPSSLTTGRSYTLPNASGELALSGAAPAAHVHDAADITTGTIATARLGSGTADNTTFLRGDNTWQAISATPALNDLTDVTISGAATGEYLRKSAGDWVNSAILAADLPTGIDAVKIGAGSVDNTELGYLNGVTSAIQAQIDGKAATSHAHSAADITSGLLALARGGTNANLSATGGTSQVLKQVSAGAAITVGTVSLSDLAAGTLAVALNLPSSLSATAGNRQVIGDSSGVLCNVPTGGTQRNSVNAVVQQTFGVNGIQFNTSGGAVTAGTRGIYQVTQGLFINVPTSGQVRIGVNNVVKLNITGSSVNLPASQNIDLSAGTNNFVLGTSGGTKIGTATNELLGLWNVTPTVQPASAAQAAYTDSTGGTAAASLVNVDTAGIADIAKINDNFATVSVLLLAMRTAMVNFGSMKGAA